MKRIFLVFALALVALAAKPQTGGDLGVLMFAMKNFEYINNTSWHTAPSGYEFYYICPTNFRQGIVFDSLRYSPNLHPTGNAFGSDTIYSSGIPIHATAIKLKWGRAIVPYRKL